MHNKVVPYLHSTRQNLMVVNYLILPILA